MNQGREDRNKVVLIGTDHHNGLGLVREFFRHGIAAYGVIVGAKRSFVRKSKCWIHTWAVQTDEEAIELILREFGNERLKPVVCPWSDGAAQAIDLNLDRLKPYFILPSIQEKQGAIVHLMNKKNQIDFAKDYVLKMLPSEIVDLPCPHKGRSAPLPVILKPVASVEGSKGDMAICHTEAEYQSTLEELAAKGFSRVLVQKYLKEREEYVVTGAVTDNRFSYTITRHIRQWPMNFGTGSFSEFVVSEEHNAFCQDVLQKIKTAGYRGTIDFEFFRAFDRSFYVNEFNWRSSGRNFVSKYTGISSAYIYYCDVTGKAYQTKLINDKSGFSMNEVNDVRHVFTGNITLWHWLHDFSITNSYAVWDWKDMMPAIAMVWNYFVNSFVK